MPLGEKLKSHIYIYIYIYIYICVCVYIYISSVIDSQNGVSNDRKCRLNLPWLLGAKCHYYIVTKWKRAEVQEIQSTSQSRIIRRVEADALMQGALVKLKSGFPCQMTDNENSFETILMINIQARKNMVD